MNAADVVAWAFDGAVYCPVHKPKGAGPMFCGYETDCPDHCDECNAFIDGQALTSEGRNYVLGKLIVAAIEYDNLPDGWLDLVDLSVDAYDALRSLPFAASQYHSGMDACYSVSSAGIRAAGVATIRECLRLMREAVAFNINAFNPVDDEAESVLDSLKGW